MKRASYLVIPGLDNRCILTTVDGPYTSSVSGDQPLEGVTSRISPLPMISSLHVISRASERRILNCTLTITRSNSTHIMFALFTPCDDQRLKYSRVLGFYCNEL